MPLGRSASSRAFGCRGVGHSLYSFFMLASFLFTTGLCAFIAFSVSSRCGRLGFRSGLCQSLLVDFEEYLLVKDRLCQKWKNPKLRGFLHVSDRCWIYMPASLLQ